MTNENSNLQRKPKRSEMSDEERVRDFQRKLYQKSKQDKELRFWVLYDKIRLPHFLREAYRRVKANKGAPGVDGVTFNDIEKRGLDAFFKEIIKELEEKSYKPSPVKRVMIPKANGKMRPLGIPTIKDRVIQMSCKMVIEPIFEADFEETSYGFRPKRSASNAVAKIKENLKSGKTEVYDADLSSYFDTIPHDKLLKLIGMRISDQNVIHLIKLWLKSPIEEDGKLSGGKENKVGTPQGGVISPLLANIYLHLIDKMVNRVTGMFRKHGVTIIRYADDFVLMGKRIPEVLLDKLWDVLKRMQLKINEDKSRLINARNTSFDFLGFTFRYDKDALFGTNKSYWNIIPSIKSKQKVRSNIKEFLRTRRHWSTEEIVKGLNRITRGWVNYFDKKGVSYPAMAKRELRHYLVERLRRYFGKKSQRKSKLCSYRAFEVLTKYYGLYNPCPY